MQRYSRWFVYALLIFLTACSLSPREDAKHAQAERACVNQCKIKLAACKQSCTDSCKQCGKENHTQMIKRYKKYLHEQCVQGRRTALQLQSFYDPLQCQKKSCDCLADYRVCVGACRGKIRKYLQVTPYCC